MSTEQEQYDTWLLDMDGVLMHEETALPGAEEFVDCLREQERQFLVLTNNSIYTRRDLAARLAEAGISSYPIIDRDHVELPHFDGSPVLTALGVGPIARADIPSFMRKLKLFGKEGR